MTSWPLPAGVPVICVSGMHRCGTSVAARTVHLLGVSLGRPDGLMPVGRDNPAGYWENKAIKELDDELFAHLGGAWDRPPLLARGWEQDPDLDPFRARAAAILTEAYGDPAAVRGPIGFKDPRLSLLLPFWRTVLPVTTTIVLARDPDEVVASLAARRYTVDPLEGYGLWLRYLCAATANDPGHLLVRHRDFFGDLPALLGRLCDHAGLPRPDEAAVAAVQAHIDPGLHHQVSQAAADDRHPLAALAHAVWNGGRPDLGVLAAPVRQALAEGWLRSPVSDEAAARARADAVTFKENLKRRSDEVKLLKERLAQLESAADRSGASSP
jgi:hypothetical protein